MIINDLIIASRDGDLKTIKYLIENGADIHDEDDLSLRWASYNGQRGTVKYLVEQGANIRALDDLSLRRASKNGHLEVVKYLIENGADIRAGGDYSLRWTSAYGYLEVAKYLKSVYIKKYKERFICFNCLVLPCCTELCSNKLIKGG